MHLANCCNEVKPSQKPGVASGPEFSALFLQPLIPGATLNLIDPQLLPQPFQRLLVHHRHMTPTLSAYYHEPVQLRIRNTVQVGLILRRHITLVVGKTPGHVVEHAAVQIDLSAFDADTVAAIKAGEEPLGQLLHHQGVQTRVRPELFVQLTLPGESAEQWYGRVVSIYRDGKPAIQVFEVLPSVDLTRTCLG